MKCDCESIHCKAHIAGGCTEPPSLKFSCYGLAQNLCYHCLGVSLATVPTTKIDWCKPLKEDDNVRVH